MVSPSFKLSLITSKHPETYQIHCRLQGCWRRHSHCSTQRLVCSPCCSRGSSQSEGGELWWWWASFWRLRLTLLTQFPLWVWSSLLLITVISPHSVAASLCSAPSDITGVFISEHPNVPMLDSYIFSKYTITFLVLMRNIIHWFMFSLNWWVDWF